MYVEPHSSFCHHRLMTPAAGFTWILNAPLAGWSCCLDDIVPVLSPHVSSLKRVPSCLFALGSVNGIWPDRRTKEKKKRRQSLDDEPLHLKSRTTIEDPNRVARQYRGKVQVKAIKQIIRVFFFSSNLILRMVSEGLNQISNDSINTI